MRLESDYTSLGAVEFPQNVGTQLGMHRFDAVDVGLYGGLPADLCSRVGYTGEAYLTVDEKVMDVGWSQRRPRAHVDGTYRDCGWGPSPQWVHDGFSGHTSIIVASDIPGCVAYRGIFHGRPEEDGDLEHIRDQLPEGELLPGGEAFLFSPDCVHESIRYTRLTKRSFLRIALVGWD